MLWRQDRQIHVHTHSEDKFLLPLYGTGTSNGNAYWHSLIWHTHVANLTDNPVQKNYKSSSNKVAVYRRVRR